MDYVQSATVKYGMVEHKNFVYVQGMEPRNCSQRCERRMLLQISCKTCGSVCYQFTVLGHINKPEKVKKKSKKESPDLVKTD